MKELKYKNGYNLKVGHIVNVKYLDFQHEPWKNGIVDKINPNSFEILTSNKTRFICQNDFPFAKSNKAFCFDDDIKSQDLKQFSEFLQLGKFISSDLSEMKLLITSLKESIDKDQKLTQKFNDKVKDKLEEFYLDYAGEIIKTQKHFKDIKKQLKESEEIRNDIKMMRDLLSNNFELLNEKLVKENFVLKLKNFLRKILKCK